MAGLVCDICGGKISMAAGGVGRCEVCGMEYTPERLREKVQELQGGAPAVPATPAAPAAPAVDTAQTVANFMTLANNAYEADNNEEAEQYCNKAIEVDPRHAAAWLLKGKAAGWQSTIKKPRLTESVAAFAKAVEYAPPEEKESIGNEARDQIKRLCRAFISLRCDRFAKWPDEEESNGILNDLNKIITILTDFIIQTGLPIQVSEFLAPLATLINQCVTKAWTDKIKPDYEGDNNRPSDREFSTYIDRIGYCTDLLERAIDLCDSDEAADIPRYENLIFLHQKAIDGCSWDWEYSGGSKRYYKSKTLTDQAKSMRRNWIAGYQSKIDAFKRKEEEAKKEAARKRFEAYWAEHAEEKEKLEATQAEITREIARLTTEKRTVAEEKKKPCDAVDQEIQQLIAQKESLGIFKGKEKKALQERIDTCRIRAKQLLDEREAAVQAVQKRIEDLKIRLAAIDRELSMDR